MHQAAPAVCDHLNNDLSANNLVHDTVRLEVDFAAILHPDGIEFRRHMTARGMRFQATISARSCSKRTEMIPRDLWRW